MTAPRLFLHAVFASMLVITATGRAQQSVPLNDTPPPLALPPLPALPTTPAKPAAKAPTAPSTKPAEKPAAKAPPSSLPTKPAPAATPKPAPPSATAPPPSGSVPSLTSQSSTSTNGQFIVYGADLETRTWFLRECETVAESLKRLLRDDSTWETKVVVSLRTAPNLTLTGPPVVANVSQLTSGGFHLQLTVQFRADLNTNEVRSELLRILLAERILRGHNEINTNRTRILPDWLLTGITEGLRYRDRARPSAMFAAVFKTGKVYGVEDIIGTSPGTLDAMTKAIYETSCCALVLALLDQPEGGLRMQKFLNSLASDTRTDRELIDQWFPGIAKSKTSMEKWWSLQMAHLSRPSVFETLSPQETLKALESALAFHYETEESGEPSAPVASKPDEPSVAKDEVRVGLLRRWFGNSDEEEKPKTDKPGAAKPGAAKPKEEEDKKRDEPLNEEQIAQQSTSVPLFTRWFGNDKKVEPKKAETKADANKAEPKKDEKKAEPKKEEAKKPEPKKQEEKKAPSKPSDDKKEAPTKAAAASKPGLLQRLFSSDKKAPPSKSDTKKDENSKAQPKPATPDKEKAQSKDKDKKTTTSIDPRLIPHLIADLWLPSSVATLLDAATAVDGPRHTILGFGKKKDEKEKEAEANAAKAKADAKAARDAVAKLEIERKAALKKAEELERQVKQAEEKKAKESASAAKPTDAKPEPPKPAAEPEKKAPPKPRRVAVSLPLDEYAKVLKRKDAKNIIAGTALDLSALAPRAHPLFQPLVADYIKWLTEIAAGHTKEADAQLKALRQRRAEVFAQARAVEDYVDVFETNGTTKWSGAFDDFLRVPQTVSDELPKRTDPLSKLLDEAEQAAKK